MSAKFPGNFWIILGSLFGFLGVSAGAFGTHSLSKHLDSQSLSIFQTGAQYQMYHALALIGLGTWANRFPEISSGRVGWAFVIGIFLFSGSLYALAISGIKALGAITPLGGIAFLGGWLTFAWLAWKSSA